MVVRVMDGEEVLFEHFTPGDPRASLGASTDNLPGKEPPPWQLSATEELQFQRDFAALVGPHIR